MKVKQLIINLQEGVFGDLEDEIAVISILTKHDVKQHLDNIFTHEERVKEIEEEYGIESIITYVEERMDDGLFQDLDDTIQDYVEEATDFDPLDEAQWEMENVN